MHPLSMFRWALALARPVLIFYVSTRTFTPDFSLGLVAGTLHFFPASVSRGTFGFLHALRPEADPHLRIDNVLPS